MVGWRARTEVRVNGNCGAAHHAGRSASDGPSVARQQSSEKFLRDRLPSFRPPMRQLVFLEFVKDGGHPLPFIDDRTDESKLGTLRQVGNEDILCLRGPTRRR